MASILRMPGISADSEEAVLLEWNLADGATISSGDLLATVETEKANVDIESDQDGVIYRTLAEPGSTVAVGAPIAVLLAVGENAGDDVAVFASLGLPTAGDVEVEEAEPPAAAPETPAETAVAEPAVLAEAAPAAVPAASPAPPGPTGSGSRVFASPLARRIARDNGITVDQLDGTGPGGRIIRADVERAIASAGARTDAAPSQTPAPAAPAAPAPAPAASAAPEPAPAASAPARVEPEGTGYTDIPHSGMRRAVARFLTQSKRDAPHFYLDATCRVDALLALRTQLNADGGVRVSINDFILKAVAKALADVPEMNVIWTDDAVRRYDHVDLSVAIGSERGLVTPVIRGAERLSLTEISAQVRDFAARAAEGKLKQNELEGGSFTVTNLGMFGVERFSAIINPPQAGILAVGAVVQQPVVVDGAIRVGSTLAVTMSVDHRPVDGVLAARWLQRFTALVENPLLILS